MRKAALALALIAFALPAPTHAQGVSFGLALGTDTPGGDLSGVRTDIGFAMDFGLRFNPVVSLDLRIDGSTHEVKSPDPGPYYQVALALSRVSFGPRFTLPLRSPLQPYLGAGLAWHEATFEDTYFDVNGWGTYLGAGVEGWVAPNQTIGLGVRWHRWDGQDILTTYKNRSTVYSLGWTIHLGN